MAITSFIDKGDQVPAVAEVFVTEGAFIDSNASNVVARGVLQVDRQTTYFGTDGWDVFKDPTMEIVNTGLVNVSSLQAKIITNVTTGFPGSKLKLRITPKKISA